MKRMLIVLCLAASLLLPAAQLGNAATPFPAADLGHSVSYGTHAVQSGETLWQLAGRYRTTIGSIQAINALTGTVINVGQQLTVPTQVIVWRAQGAPQQPPAPPASTNFAQEVLRLTNVERAKAGLPALIDDAALRPVAQEKARDMYENGYFSHTSPTYGSPFAMMRNYGVTYSYAAENIAKGYQTPSAVVSGWMSSSGHRANILNANLTHLGVGVAGDVWVQMFRRP